MVQIFPPSPFVFHVGLSCGFKGSGGLVNCASPVQAIGCLCCQLMVIDVACGEELLHIFSRYEHCWQRQCLTTVRRVIVIVT